MQRGATWRPCYLVNRATPERAAARVLQVHFHEFELKLPALDWRGLDPEKRASLVQAAFCTTGRLVYWNTRLPVDEQYIRLQSIH